MESVLESAGSCGRYQILHVIFTQLPRFVALWSMMFMMFGGYDPGWRCIATDPAPDRNTSANFIAEKDNNSFWNGGTLPQEFNFSMRHDNEFNNLTTKSFNSISDSNIYNGTCDTMDSCTDVKFNPVSETIVTRFELICDKRWVIRAILFAQGLGSFLGPLVCGHVGEMVGKKRVLYSSVAVICLCSCVAIFSTHWLMFAFCSFVIGAAGNSIYAASEVFTLEFLNAKWRGYFGSIPTSNISLISFALLTFVLKNWIYFQMLTIGLGVFTCAGFFLLPESTRWLVIKGKMNSAKKSISRIAKINKIELDVDEEIFTKLHEIAEKEKEAKTKYTLLDLFRNKQLCSYAIRFAVIFFIFETSYLSVMYGTRSLPGDYYTNAIEASCLEAVIVVTIGPLCNRIGRRISGLLFAVLGLVSSVSIVLVLYDTDDAINEHPILLKILSYLARSSSQSISVIAVILSTELFPTVVRNLSAGLFRCCSGAATLVVPFLTPEDDPESLIICFSVMGVLYVVCAAIFPSFPETKQCDLTDDLDQNVTVNCNNDEDNDNDNGNKDDHCV